MSPRKPKDEKPIKRIKTGAFERQWQLTKSGIKASSVAGTQMWGSLLLNKDKRQQRNSRILSEQAQYLADELGKLKGAVVKVGQMMALYGEHILPEEVTLAFRSLEENTTALAWSAIEPILIEQLGDAYADFEVEEVPLGAASLSQVHKALHKPSGDYVCLKVQYPGVANAIDNDIASVMRLLRLANLVKSDPSTNDWLEEIRRLLNEEVDYQLETEKSEYFYRLVAGHPILRVPKVYPQYSSKTLLVNSFEAGVAVNAAEVLTYSQAQRNLLGKTFLQLFLDEVFQWGMLQTDPNFGNYRIRQSAQGEVELVLLDFGSVMRYPDSFLQPLKNIVLSAYDKNAQGIRQASIDLGIMQDDYPENVHQDFAQLCYLLLEPFTHQHNGCPDHALNSQGEYRWASSQLPRRAAKHAAQSAMSRYFAVPPKEFAFVSRKLLGVYSFIAALEAEFNPGEMLAAYRNA